MTLPGTLARATLVFHLKVNSGSSGTLKAEVRSSGGEVLATLATFTHGEASPGYLAHTFDLSAYKGRAVQIAFAASLGSAQEDLGSSASFVLDHVRLVVD